MTALKYLQLRFRPSFRLYLVSTSWIVPFKTTTSYTEHKTRKSKYESKKLKHRNQNVIAQNTMSHIGFRRKVSLIYTKKRFLISTFTYFFSENGSERDMFIDADD